MKRTEPDFIANNTMLRCPVFTTRAPTLCTCTAALFLAHVLLHFALAHCAHCAHHLHNIMLIIFTTLCSSSSQHCAYHLHNIVLIIFTTLCSSSSQHCAHHLHNIVLISVPIVLLNFAHCESYGLTVV